MNILIIGNGFDLAHGLPTKYTDFLQYCRDYDKNDPVSISNEQNEEFNSLVGENVWLKYFLNTAINLDNTKTWIDFEKEVAKVIQNMDLVKLKVETASYFNNPSENMLVLLSSNKIVESFIKPLCTPFTSNSFVEREGKFILTNKRITDIESFINFVYYQLRDFTRAFEIYCQKINETSILKPVISSERKNQINEKNKMIESYANQLKYRNGSATRKDYDQLETSRKIVSQELFNLSNKINPIDYLSFSKFDCVLSFNYTNTYQRLYGNVDTKYCYIHGKAQENKNNTNIIFGINDELSKGEESNDFKWIRFKKFYQRIIFKTGSEYKDWITSKTNRGNIQNYVHIVGLSLDRTDYDVLYEIFSNHNLKIIVYYYCLEDFEDKVQKVIRLLAYKGLNGRDELIHRAHGSQWSIKFVNQYDKVEGLFVK